jgi:hypothetical protein
MCSGSKYLIITPEILKLIKKAHRMEFHEQSAVFIKDGVRSYVDFDNKHDANLAADVWLNDSLGDAIKALLKVNDNIFFMNQQSDFSTNTSISRGIEVDGIYLYIERDFKTKYKFLVSAKPRTI